MIEWRLVCSRDLHRGVIGAFGQDTLQALPCGLDGGLPWPPTVLTKGPKHAAVLCRAVNQYLLALHRLEKLVVGFRFLELVGQKLDGGQVFHAVQQFAQNPHALQFILGRE